MLDHKLLNFAVEKFYRTNRKTAYARGSPGSRTQWLHDSPQLNGSVKESNKLHNHETENITRKACHAAENLSVVVKTIFRSRD